MSKQEKKYGGSVYLGAVGADTEPGYCRDSIVNIQRRNGDSEITYTRATKGYEARQTHVNRFLDSKHDFLFLMDHDMHFPADTLENLRRHELPFVTGLYMRRHHQPIMPVWFYPFDGKWPMRPWSGPIERGKLHQVGASGWGCILVHRDVILAVKELLRGEWVILEDDMDVWPYEIGTVMGAISGLKSLVTERPTIPTLYPALEHHVRTLQEQIRPLRGDHDIIGSDIRFAWYANQAGFPLWGDPEVRPTHNLDYPLSPDDFDALPIPYRDKAAAELEAFIAKDRARIAKNLKGLKQ